MFLKIVNKLKNNYSLLNLWEEINDENGFEIYLNLDLKEKILNKKFNYVPFVPKYLIINNP